MTAVPAFPVDQRRVRLAVRHHLAPGTAAETVELVARDVVGLHGTDPASVILAIRARLRDPTLRQIERELYEERTVLRMLGMRRTMFVEPVDLVPIVQAACTNAIANQQRTLTRTLLTRAGVAADVDAWLADVEESTLVALRARGEALAGELTADEPRLATKIRLADGKAYQADANIVTRVLLTLAADGRIVRGRPRGSWISGQYRWAPVESWLPRGIPPMPVADAQRELVRAWLGRFGPGTANDIKWWSGLTLGEVRRALAACGAVEVSLDGVPGYVLADDRDSGPDPESWIAMLPALDPTVMGWAERGWYLGGHRPALFDTNGNAGPTIWVDGRVVGGWGQHPSGRVVVRVLEDVGRETAVRIEEEADRLERWIGDIRVTPRFRTPLEKEIAASATPPPARPGGKGIVSVTESRGTRARS
jgi:hypothetical protein